MMDFGLPKVSSDPQKQRMNAAQVRHSAPLILMHLFKQIEAHLGVHETRRVFEQSAALHSKTGKGRGPVDSVRDAELLDLHDAGKTAKQIYEFAQARQKQADEFAPALLRRASAGRRSHGSSFGHSEDAIKQKLKRLLKERNERREQERGLDEAYQQLQSDMARLDSRGVSRDK
jgi:hypothetical protein